MGRALCIPPHGFALPELIVCCALLVTLAAVAIPAILAGLDRHRGYAAARYLASRMMLARAQAVSRSATIALRFDGDDERGRFGVFQDGNGNGVRAVDIARGIDRAIEPPVRLADLFSGVTLSAPSGPSAGGGAVQTGRTPSLSFTPLGTATSGTIYLRGRDGTEWAVRVLGATARTRVLRYDARSGGWVGVF